MINASQKPDSSPASCGNCDRGTIVPIHGREGLPDDQALYCPAQSRYMVLVDRQEVVELAVQQELSNFVLTTTGVNNSPTLIKRSVATKLSLKPGEVAVMAGLVDDQNSAGNSRLPFLGWLIGQEKQLKQSEILLFIQVDKI